MGGGGGVAARTVPPGPRPGQERVPSGPAAKDGMPRASSGAPTDPCWVPHGCWWMTAMDTAVPSGHQTAMYTAMFLPQSLKSQSYPSTPSAPSTPNTGTGGTGGTGTRGTRGTRDTRGTRTGGKNHDKMAGYTGPAALRLCGIELFSDRPYALQTTPSVQTPPLGAGTLGYFGGGGGGGMNPNCSRGVG